MRGFRYLPDEKIVVNSSIRLESEIRAGRLCAAPHR
jgi:hypothetical protein